MRAAATLTSLMMLTLLVVAQPDHTLNTDGRLMFPLPMPSVKLIDAARACPLGDPPVDVNGTPVVTPAPAPDDTASTGIDATGCALAQKLLQIEAERGSDATVSDQEQILIRQIAILNPALLLRDQVFDPYFDRVTFVNSVYLHERVVTHIDIDYTVADIHSSVEASIHIDDAATEHPRATGQVILYPDGSTMIDTPVAAEQVLRLAGSLTDLIPVLYPVTAITCPGRDPDWHVTLTLSDGSSIDARTYNSNVITTGGPMQFEIDGEHYLQFGTAFDEALAGIFTSLRIPVDASAALACPNPDRGIFRRSYDFLGEG